MNIEMPSSEKSHETRDDDEIISTVSEFQKNEYDKEQQELENPERKDGIEVLKEQIMKKIETYIQKEFPGNDFDFHIDEESLGEIKKGGKDKLTRMGIKNIKDLKIRQNTKGIENKNNDETKEEQWKSFSYLVECQITALRSSTDQKSRKVEFEIIVDFSVNVDNKKPPINEVDVTFRYNLLNSQVEEGQKWAEKEIEKSGANVPKKLFIFQGGMPGSGKGGVKGKT